MMSHAADASTDVVVGGAAAPLTARAVRTVVDHVLAAEGRHGYVAVNFVGKSAMRRLNATHLAHDWPADVISFPLPQPDGSLAGDIYICRYVAAQEARSRGHSVRDELIRLVVHGTLHVAGYDHPDGDARMTSPMWTLQERHMKALT